MKKFLLALFIGLSINAQAQYWQQAVHYDMDITMDVVKHKYDGAQKNHLHQQQSRHPSQGVLPSLLQRLSAGKHDGRSLPKHR